MPMVFNRYRWTKDGKDFTPPQSATSKTQPQSNGNFVLANSPRAMMQGTYQCHASNKLGTAMTDHIQLLVPSELNERTKRQNTNSKATGFICRYKLPTFIIMLFFAWSFLVSHKKYLCACNVFVIIIIQVPPSSRRSTLSPLLLRRASQSSWSATPPRA